MSTKFKPDPAYKMPLREARTNLRLAFSLFWNVDVFYAWYKLKQAIKHHYRAAKTDTAGQETQITIVLCAGIATLFGLAVWYLHNVNLMQP